MILDIAAMIGAALALLGSIFSVIYSTKSKDKQEEKILAMKHDFELRMLALEKIDKSQDDYERQRRTAIKKYCDSMGAFFANTYDHSAFGKLQGAIGEIFMYTPQEKHGQITELNDLCARIYHTNVQYDDDGAAYYTRNSLEKEALSLYHQLSLDFANLGTQAPSKTEN